MKNIDKRLLFCLYSGDAGLEEHIFFRSNMNLIYLLLACEIVVVKSTIDSGYFKILSVPSKPLSVLQTRRAKNTFDCLQLCIETTTCHSISFHNQSIDGAHSCMLSSIRAEQKLKCVEAAENWIYYEKVRI